MKLRKCPYCNRRKIDIESSLYGKNLQTPTIQCPYCNKTYSNPSYREIALEPYNPPRKSQIFLCGLWPCGICGFAIIIGGMLFNRIWLVLLGGIVFSFWILLIAMSFSLWNEICANAKKAYEESLARIQETKKCDSRL